MALSPHSSPFYFSESRASTTNKYSPLQLLEADSMLPITAATSEVIPRGKSFGSARIQTQNSCVTVSHSNHVAKELTQQWAVRNGTVTTDMNQTRPDCISNLY